MMKDIAVSAHVVLLFRETSGQHRAVCLQDYTIGDGIAKVSRNLARLTYTQTDQARLPGFGMSKDTLHRVSEVDYELGRVSWVQARSEQVLHLVAQRFGQYSGVGVCASLNRQNLKHRN